MRRGLVLLVLFTGDVPSGRYAAENRAHALRPTFAVSGADVRSTGARAWQVGLKLRAYGYGEALIAAGSGSIRASGNRVEIARTVNDGSRPAPLLEWYVNLEPDHRRDDAPAGRLVSMRAAAATPVVERRAPRTRRRARSG